MEKEEQLMREELLGLLSRNKKELDSIVLNFLPGYSRNEEINNLYEMMRDYPARGGKGFRGSLCLSFCELLGGQREVALTTAAGLELFQNWILIHDDVEDESDMRRGSPSLHRKYGVARAINTGDALHGKMWELLINKNTHLGDKTSFRILEEFSTMINETTEGQQMELTWTVSGKWDVSEEDYLLMVTKKSAWYTCTSPCRMGAILAYSAEDSKEPHSESEILHDLVDMGTHMGIAFQIVDDILNLTASEHKYGKEIMGDLFEGKRTLMLIHLLSTCNQAEREKVISILSKTRRERNYDEVKMIYEWMVNAGSLEYAREIANKYASLGKASFESICRNAKLGDERAIRTARFLLEFLVKRDH